MDVADVVFCDCPLPGARDEIAGRVTIECAEFADVSLPAAHPVHSGFSLPFCTPNDFGAVWKRILEALRAA